MNHGFCKLNIALHINSMVKLFNDCIVFIYQNNSGCQPRVEALESLWVYCASAGHTNVSESMAAMLVLSLVGYSMY